MKKIVTYLCIVSLWASFIQGMHDEVPSNAPSADVVEQKETPKTEPVKIKVVKKESPKKVGPYKRILFLNARVNDIILIITNYQNKQTLINLKMGHQHHYHYYDPIIKVVCHEKLTPKTTLTKADIDNYTAFVFNDNQKTDKYHYISIHEKNKALKHARLSGDISLFNNVCEETIYNS